MHRKLFLLLSLFIFFVFAGKANAFKPETFVTLANPIRGLEGWQTPGQDPLAMPLFQYTESTHSALPVTWLLRYDAVYNATMSAFFADLTEMDKNQSLGAFLEITPVLTLDADVTYPTGNLFFNANRIFLSGYSIGDRKKLIDTYMTAFFKRYGYYPKSVSAWHLDSHSLQYLQEKYSVLTAMNCDDQYSTDSYRLWGGYLGSAYFPDKNNSLIPAKSFDERVNLAMVRWAQRDLFNFYGFKSESNFSVQVNDFLSMGLTTKYFDKLLAQYGQKQFNEFTYINIGLENDYYLPAFRNEIINVYKSLIVYKDKHNIRFSSLADFGNWLKIRYPESSPTYYYESDDPRGVEPGKTFWYQSPFYRIGFKSVNGKTEIIDFRVYNREIYEEYFATPNQQLSLYHEIPAVIDSVKFPGTAVQIDLDLEVAKYIHSKQWDYWRIAFEYGGRKITLDPDRISFTGFSAPDVDSKDITVVTNRDETVWELTPHTPYKKDNRFTWLFWIVIALIVISLIKKIDRKGKPKLSRTVIIGVAISLLAGFTLFRNGLLYPFGMGFWGPNGHDAIFHLSLIEKFARNPFNFNHPQIAGANITNYHLFFDYLSGLLVRWSGLSSIDLYFRIFPVIAGIAIVILLNKLLRSWNYSRPERLLAIFFVFLAGSFGFIPKLITGQDFFTGESAFWSNQSVSIFLNPPFALSIIFLLILLTRLPHRSKVGNHNSGIGFWVVILGGLLAQTKIYAFILLLSALFFTKKYKLMLGILVLGILVSLPFTTIGGESPFIFSPLWFPRSLFASFDRFYWPRLVEAWQAYEASGDFIKLTFINLFALGIFLLGNLGMRIFGLIHLGATKAGSDSEKIVRAMTLLGLILPILFIQNVNPWNTIQFMYYSLFFLGIFTAKYVYKFKIYILIPFLILAVITSIGTLKDYTGYFSSSRLGYTELLALDKLKDQPEGIVLSPLYYYPRARNIYAPKPLYSYVSTAYISALSGQPEFLSDTINLDITGLDYLTRARDIQRFYNTMDKQWGIDFLTKNKISYVYETPLQKLKLAPFDLKLTKIFDSGEINIYKFN